MVGDDLVDGGEDGDNSSHRCNRGRCGVRERQVGAGRQQR